MSGKWLDGGLASEFGFPRIGEGSNPGGWLKTTIELGRGPFVPSYWKLDQHVGHGDFIYNPRGLRIYRPAVENGSSILVESIDWLRDGPPDPCNANLLDWYLNNPFLIPDTLKDFRLLFPGTTYLNGLKNRCIRGLKWCPEGWNWMSANMFDTLDLGDLVITHTNETQ